MAAKMRDKDRSRDELLVEIAEMRVKVVESERAKAESARTRQELRRSREFYRSIIELGVSVYAVVDAEGNITYESPSLQRAYGWKPEELVGRSVFELVHPDDIPGAQAAFAELLANPGLVQTAEVRYRHKDASWSIVEVTGVNLLDNPAVGGIVLSSYDVSPRKWAEEALRQVKGSFAAFIEHSPFAYVEADLEGRLSFANARAAAIFGYTVEELRGMAARDLLPPDEAQRAEANLAAALAGEAAALSEYRALTKDGRSINVEVTALPMKKAGKPFGFQVTIADITERKRAEEALKQSEMRFRELAELLPEIVYEMDERGVLTYANRCAFEITGYTQAEFEKGFEALSILVPADRKRARENMVRAMRGEALGPREYTVLRKDGSTFPALSRSAPIIRDGQAVGLRGVLFNISHQKQLESDARDAPPG